MHTERTRADEGLRIAGALVESTSTLARTNTHQYDNTLCDWYQLLRTSVESNRAFWVWSAVFKLISVWDGLKLRKVGQSNGWIWVNLRVGLARPEGLSRLRKKGGMDVGCVVQMRRCSWLNDGIDMRRSHPTTLKPILILGLHMDTRWPNNSSPIPHTALKIDTPRQ